MNSTEIRKILKISVPTDYETDVFACDQLNQISSKKFAIIFNSDDSTKSGLHWLALYKEPKKDLEFFDSFAMPISFYSPFVKKYIANISNEIILNNIQLQSNFSEVCGQFCIYFLLKRINNISFKNIVNEFDQNNLNNNDNIVKTFVDINFKMTHLTNNIKMYTINSNSKLKCNLCQCCKNYNHFNKMNTYF